MDRDLEAIAQVLATVKEPTIAENVTAVAIYLKYERFQTAREELGVALAKQPDLAPLRQARNLLDAYIANRPTPWQRVLAFFGRKPRR